MLIDPKDSIKFFVSNVGDVMGVLDGHVHEAGLCDIVLESHHLVCTDAAEFYLGFTLDHCEAFGFAGVEVVTAGDAGTGGAEADLSSTVEFDGFDETASVVGVEH